MNTSEERDWLKMVYEQAWGQYTHEDQMSEQRDTKFLTILSLFLTAAGVLCTMVLSYVFAEQEEQSSKVYSLGMLAVILLIAFLVRLFLKHWEEVNETAEVFIKARLKTIKEIEDSVGTPICMEEPKIEKKDGFGSTKEIIKLLKVVSYTLMGLALAGMVGVIVFL